MASPSGARRFELEEHGASKFWEVAVSGASHTVRFGRIGSDGQIKTKSFPSAEAAAKDAEALIRSKVKKGYREVSASAARETRSTPAPRPSDPIAQLDVVVRRLAATQTPDEGHGLEWWDTTGEPLAHLAKTETKRRQALASYAKQHELPADFAEFVARYGFPDLSQTVLGRQGTFSLRLSPYTNDLTRPKKKTRLTTQSIQSNGSPLPAFALADGRSPAFIALPSGWIVAGGDFAYPDGVGLGPAAGSFGDVFLACALGLADALFAPSGKPRARTEALLSRLGADDRRVARDVLDRLERTIADRGLEAADDVYDPDIVLAEGEGSAAMILVTASDVPNGPKACRSARRPRWVDLPFVFYDSTKKLEKPLDAIPDEHTYDDRGLDAGDAIAAAIHEHLYFHGGCPESYRFFPALTKERLRTELAARGLDVREGTTELPYTLARGAQAVRARIAALRPTLR